MSNLKYFALVIATALFVFSAQSAFSQTAPVRGVVKVHKQDGTEVPVADVTVDAYRTDIGKGSMPAAKTNKRGEFSFVGFQLGQTYALAVSGPGISPQVLPNVKAGREDIVIIANEGDGRKVTEQEARDFVTKYGTMKSDPGKAAAKSKEQEEVDKKNAEITANNKKIQDADAIAQKSNAAGIEALNAKNYDLAIAKFDEGITAVPDYVGSTPVMLNGKLVALKARGFDKYREGAPLTDLTARRAKYDEANRDYDDALKAFDQAMAVLKAAPAAANPAEQKQRDTITLGLLSNAIEVHRLKAVSGIDGSKADQAATIVEQYIAVEPDAAKKSQARATLGDIMRTSGQFDKAIAAYRSVLEASPDNLEVMASLGLSLVALGTSVDPPNKDQLQEGLNYMQKYADTVQILPTDPKNVQEFKQSVKDTVEYLKTDQKLKAQPVKAAPKKGKG